ncbi:MAG: hypothetical protein ABI355_05865 [Solirubrobacteraceae bacterium]
MAATETRPSDRGESTRPSSWHLAAAVASILVGIAVVFAVPELRHAVSLALTGDFSGLRNYVNGLGAGGLVLVLALMLAHAVIFYPTEVITATAAFVFGFLPGLAIAIVGWLASALLSYALGIVLGRPILHAAPRAQVRASGADDPGRRTDAAARSAPDPELPVQHHRLCRPREPLAFVWTTVVGYLPLTIAVAYLGSQAQSLSVGNPAIWATVLLLVGLLITAHLVMRRRAHR